jgi:hypothetical protein
VLSLEHILLNLEHFLVNHQVGLGIAGSLIGIAGAIFAVWRYGRRVLVAVVRWVRLVFDEARPGTTIVRYPLLIQSGDRRQISCSQERHGQNLVFRVRIALNITNLESRELLISKARLHYRQSWLTRAEQEGDVGITDPFSVASANGVLPPGRMMYGQGSWTFLNPLVREPHQLTASVSITDQFGRQSWSRKIKVRWMNDPARFL